MFVKTVTLMLKPQLTIKTYIYDRIYWQVLKIYVKDKLNLKVNFLIVLIITVDL